MRIDPIITNLCEGAPGATIAKNPDAAGPASFADELKSKIGEVDRLIHDSDSQMQQGATKGASNIHETLIQMEQANMGMLLLAKVRNKALDAYHEVMRMSF